MHICWTIQKSPVVWNVYINGVLKTPDSTYGTLMFPNNIPLANCYIGKSAWGALNDYFKGYFDDFRIYKRAITATEVTKVYNGQSLVTPSTTATTTNTVNYLYYASGGGGAGSSAVTIDDVNTYGDGGSGVQTSIIVPKTYGQGGGGGSSLSYGYAGGKGTGKNSTVAAADGAPNTGAGGGGGKLDSLGGSGGSGLVAIVWTQADTMELNQEADANMSNYVSQVKQQLETSIESSSNQLVNVLNTDLLSINNYFNETSNEVYNRLNNLSTDTIITSIDSSNKFIVNNIWNDNLVVSGTLYASNLSVVGSNIIVYTNAYTTENLSVITGAESVDGLTITHTGEGLHNILTATVADSPAMIITKDGYVGIGKTDPTSPLDIVGDLKITGNILPTADQVYDLGSPATKWRDLYLSGNSIYLGDNTRISSDTETGGIAIQDGAGNLKELSASAYKIRDPETSQVFSMKLGADKKIKFVTVDETNPNAVEEEVGTAADVWSSNAGYISYGNVKIYDSSSSVIMSVGDNVKIYDGSITILNNSIEQKLITESSTSLISFYGADAISSETTNNILDITNVPYKKSGRNANRYYKVFDISIISSANNLLFSSTLFRTYLKNDPSLIAWYKFDDENDLRTDSSGNNNIINSPLNTIIYKNDNYTRNNTGYVALNTYLSSADVISGDNITISFWFQSPSGFGSHSRDIYFIKNSVDNSTIFTFNRNNNVGDRNLSFQYFTNGTSISGTIALAYAYTWYHITTTIKKNNVNGVNKAYISITVNGVNSVISNNDWNWQDMNGYFYINNASFSKQIDDLRIYNRALSNTEILALYNNSTILTYYPDGVDNQLKFSYYSTNNVTSSHNGDGIMFKDNDIWFETVNGIEYMKSSMANDNVLSVTSR